MNSLELLRAKEAIFKLIAQFHNINKADNDEFYIYNYCESALESAFDVLGIEDNKIDLKDFCKLWEDNSRAIWAIVVPEEEFTGCTADMHYDVFVEAYKSRIVWLEDIDNE